MSWEDDEPTPVAQPQTRSAVDLRHEANLALAHAEVARWKELAESRRRDLDQEREARAKAERDRRRLLLQVESLRTRVKELDEDNGRLRRRIKE